MTSRLRPEGPLFGVRNRYWQKHPDVIVMAHRSLIVRKILLALQLVVVVGTVAVPALLGTALIVWGIAGHAESFYLMLLGAGLIIGAGILSRAHISAYRAGIREGRRELSLCLNCGCDLRGSEERCPECGVEIVKPPTHWPPAFRVRRLVGVFPELLRFETSEQERAWARAANNWRTNAYLAALFVPALFLLFYVLPITISYYNLPPQVASALGCFVIGVSLGYLAYVRTRRTICRKLRRRLIDMDVPICLGCGYDLRVSKERCPECGTEFQSSGV